jgi:predicted metal-dependent hydrolase
MKLMQKLFPGSADSDKTIEVDGIGKVQIIRNIRSKRLRIAVKTSGDVVVTIPASFPFSKGEDFLREKKEWVVRTQKKLEKQGIVTLQLQPGDLFATRNATYVLAERETDKIKVLVRREEKIVVIAYPIGLSLSSPDNQKKISKVIEGVLRYEAKRYLPLRMRELADMLGYSFKVVTIKSNRSNWGSCSSLGNINLNLHLMRLSDRLIDFVIVHELVHTKIRNHGPNFKSAMKQHFPDIGELESALKKFRPGLI